MKVLIAALLLLAMTNPVFAGYQPPKTGGPSSSRGGGGTRVLAPLLKQAASILPSQVVFDRVFGEKQGF